MIACGLVVGFVAAIMGVGGGFLTFPMYVYGLGVSTFTTVATDILQIIFTTCYASIFQYAVYGFVFYTVAVGMLLGSLVGVQIGALVRQAREDLRSVAADLAIQAAGKLLAKSVDDATQRKLVEDYLKDLNELPSGPSAKA